MTRSLVTRRTVLRTGALSALAVGLVRIPPASAASAAGAASTTVATTADFASLRQRWSDLFVGGALDPTDADFAASLAALDASIATGLARIDTSAGRTALFTDKPLGSVSANLVGTFQRLRLFAQGYVTPGSRYQGDATVLAATLDGIDWMLTAAYVSSEPRFGYDNWFHWEVSGPAALLDTGVFLHPQVGSDRIAAICAAVDHFVPDPTLMYLQSTTITSTGANRTALCQNVIVRGVLGDDSERVAAGAAGIPATLPLVTTGDGVYADGSFIQHTNYPYAGNYGIGWLGGTTYLIALLDGSAWAITDPNVDNLFFAATDTFMPNIYDGVMLDAQRGRQIARSDAHDYADGTTTLNHLINLAGVASPDLAARLRSFAKGSLSRSPQSLATMTDVATVSTLKSVLDDDSVTAAAEVVGHRLYPSSARAVHRRPGWLASLSMASDTISWYETGNGENLRGWHESSGMVQLYRSDDDTPFSSDGGFWATVDPYRLPGTTASQLPLADAQGGPWANPRPTGALWVGGASDGEFATVGQDLRGPFSTLSARKAWFFLDDAVICLGAGITATDGAEVDTVVENRRSTAALTIDGRAVAAGSTGTRRDARWAHLDGVAGYLFPGGADLTALRETRTGRWRDVWSSGSTTAISNDFATLYLDHGVDPTAASYAYVVLPGADAATTARRARSRWLAIEANTSTAQAIRVPSLGVTAANLYAAGRVGGTVALSTDGPAAVLIREDRRAGTVTLSVSDPTARLTGLTLTWDHPVAKVLSKPATVTSARTGRRLTLTFGDLTGTPGATQQVVVATDRRRR